MFSVLALTIGLFARTILPRLPYHSTILLSSALVFGLNQNVTGSERDRRISSSTASYMLDCFNLFHSLPPLFTCPTCIHLASFNSIWNILHLCETQTNDKLGMSTWSCGNTLNRKQTAELSIIRRHLVAGCMEPAACSTLQLAPRSNFHSVESFPVLARSAWDSNLQPVADF